MTLCVLYKKTATGATQEWSVRVEGTTIITRYGQTGGAMQEARDQILSGKNIGRKNATTTEQQAELEAKALWEKKLKKGYAQTVAAAMAGEVDAVVEGGVFPMLAHRWDQHSEKVRWPAFVQPKLDGHRCIAVLEDGKASLWSRTRKPIHSMPHIVAALEGLGVSDAIFDGELYTHELKSKFEELSSLIRSSEPASGHEVMQYHVYDLPSDTSPFAARYNALHAMLIKPTLALTALRIVATYTAVDEDDMLLYFGRFIEQGYEGLMIRNAAGRYANRRSYDLLKVKDFQDCEYPVVDVVEGRGKMEGRAIFTCRAANGEEFNVKMVGPLANLEQYVKDPALAVGRQLTVKYQRLTDRGVPHAGIALRFKEAE